MNIRFETLKILKAIYGKTVNLEGINGTTLKNLDNIIIDAYNNGVSSGLDRAIKTLQKEDFKNGTSNQTISKIADLPLRRHNLKARKSG